MEIKLFDVKIKLGETETIISGVSQKAINKLTKDERVTVTILGEDK